jgi:hypothetical protein
MSTKATWTVMVYISADKVLANFAIESLKQLERAAGDGVTVVAQFDANVGGDILLLHFAGAPTNGASLKENSPYKISPPLDMAAPETLTAFINHATKENPANHYFLILNGHGTELLLDEDQPVQNNGQASAPERIYLTPANLKIALEATDLFTAKKKLDIIGFDACSMSMAEVAIELQGCADFMIASQDDVPDASFPYAQILTWMRTHDRNDVPGICAVVPGIYRQAFQDYVAAPEFGTSELTLASLKLKAAASIAGSPASPLARPLEDLSMALLASTSNHEEREAIIAARRAARGFVLGVFVDLFDFCEHLSSDSTINGQLRSACDKVRVALTVDESGFVIKNETSKSGESHCHGVSVYFPFFGDADNQQIVASLGADQSDAVSQLSLMVKGGKDSLRKARTARLEELEADLKELDQLGNTGWGKFVTQGWSYILATELPEELDRRYSGQQCARNLIPLCQPPKPQEVPQDDGFAIVRKSA